MTDNSTERSTERPNEMPAFMLRLVESQITSLYQQLDTLAATVQALGVIAGVPVSQQQRDSDATTALEQDSQGFVRPPVFGARTVAPDKQDSQDERQST